MDGHLGDTAPRRFPRACGSCGEGFAAARRHARWCSDRCRLRAWRQRRHPAYESSERTKNAVLLRQVLALQAALERAHAGQAYAAQGCQLADVNAATRARQQADQAAQLAPWRGAKWEHPAFRTLRVKVPEQADELNRLRQENGLLRRRASQRRNGGEPRRPGA